MKVSGALWPVPREMARTFDRLVWMEAHAGSLFWYKEDFSKRLDDNFCTLDTSNTVRYFRF